MPPASSKNNAHSAWHREPWVWFIIGVITLAVLWGAVQLTTSILLGDAVVVDDYYKNGKAINQDLTRDKNAQKAALHATVTINTSEKIVVADVQGRLLHWPSTLTLTFQSPAFPEQDRWIRLTKIQHQEDSAHYSGHLNSDITGRYYVQLSTPAANALLANDTNDWRLTRETTLEPETPIRLTHE
ncbi:hypothetical protein CI610_00851 [invertebrate metagenome]|uniref:Analog of CcoH, COG3198 n=1 Tax=invertebrate metagenome TaxID=1711999 RepID=A0A2H9TAC0_9ZZZZ